MVGGESSKQGEAQGDFGSNAPPFILQCFKPFLQADYPIEKFLDQNDKAKMKKS